MSTIVDFELPGEPGGTAELRSVSFRVPGEPVAFARSGGNGTVRFTPKRQRDFMSLIKLAAHTAMQDRPPIDGAVRLTIDAFYAVPKSWPKKRAAAANWKTSTPDADNLAKLASDGMNDIVFYDDSQVAELTVRKRYAERAGLFIRVEQIEATQ